MEHLAEQTRRSNGGITETQRARCKEEKEKTMHGHGLVIYIRVGIDLSKMIERM